MAILLLVARALIRLQCDHVARHVVPGFYRYLQAQDEAKQIEGGKDFHKALEDLTVLLERAEKEIPEKKGLGLWVEGGDLGLLDVIVAPCKCLVNFNYLLCITDLLYSIFR